MLAFLRFRAIRRLELFILLGKFNHYYIYFRILKLFLLNFELNITEFI